MTSVVYVPNEWPHFEQSGYRAAFSALLSEGSLTEVRTFSLLKRVRLGDAGAAHKELLQVVRKTRPAVVLFQHVDGMLLDDEYLRELRSASGAKILYQEADAYGHGKRLRNDGRVLARVADMVFCSGKSTFAETFGAYSKRVEYAPNGLDQARFAPAGDSAASLSGNIVMIANRVTSRAFWRNMPGSKERLRLARAIQNSKDPNSHVFGRGWSGSASRGPVGYDDQVALLARYKVSVNWDHFPKEDAYFSDRLPISMLSGRPVITTWHPGYEWLPGAESGLHFARNAEESMALAESLIHRESGEVAELPQWAAKYLSHENILRYMLTRSGVMNEDSERFPWWT